MKRTLTPSSQPGAGNQPASEIHTYVQINTTCNQKCVFCNRPPENSEKQIFRLKDVEKTIQNAAKTPGVKRVVFTGGEPLLAPDLAGAIRLAKQYGFITEIQTNGTLLDANKLSELKKAGLDTINFALHSHKERMSNKLRGVSFGFASIAEHLQLAYKSGFTIHVIHVINSLNYKDLPGFIDYVHRLRVPDIWLNLSIVVPEGWAWENKWIIPRMGQLKPFLQKAMKKCKKYDIHFDVSEIVPLCIANGFEDHVVSTVFKLSNFLIIDDYLSGKRELDFSDPSPERAMKAPQCKSCTVNALCAGFYPRMKELYGVGDFVPRKDDLARVYKKLHHT